MVTRSVAGRGGARVDKREAAIEQAVRRQVARELHDLVAQTLTGMLVDVENFKSQPVGWEDVLKQLETVQSSTRQVLANLRQLVHDLRGDELVGQSFIEVLGHLVRRFEEKTTIGARLDVHPGWPATLTPPATLNLYRIVEEALVNVRMHSGAHSVRIVLECEAGDQLALLVDDDGRGLDMHESRPLGLGTVGMRERAVFLGGKLHIDSAPGGGTRVHAVFPRMYVVPSSPEPRNQELLRFISA